ncbi:DUF1565 domain-containing protein [Hyalangium rubrum]|uniref:DUF1565 domain-containing protein n=1 Tax=Hyalangium rubrum TaxID=3103134 RepID=A0ABU5H6Z8_9BACT|nr:DUF1565 domain-containing protein [Hyalangium sp. s54d21]MDY7229247.1 DUF1565 domain-containing protein [Hyalangium sp. s54d21]
MSPRVSLLALLLIAACRASTVPPSPIPEPAAGLSEVWVDGARGESGDGSRQRPFRTLGEALALRPPPTVYVAAGLHEGPFVLPTGARLVGVGPSTVLYVEGREPVARIATGASLERLTIQGGGWGVEGAGAVRLEEVAFSGQREGAVRMTAGRLVAKESRFEASISETVGLALEGPVTAEVRESTFTGPFRRGVRVAGAEALLEGVGFREAVMALDQEGGRVRLRRVSVEGGRGAGLLVRDGTLQVEEVTVTGHEYGLASHGAKLEVRGFTSVRAERAGLGLTRSTGLLEDLRVRESGSFGALQLVDSDLEVRGFRVDDVDGYGVAATKGKLRAREGNISRVRSSEGFTGDGLHLRGVEADIESVEVREAKGAGVLAAQGAEVTLRDVTLRGCENTGLLVESLARVKAQGLEVRGTKGTALAVLRDGEVSVDVLSASGLEEGLLWAECEGATRVRLGRLKTEDRRGLPAPCVETLPR